MDGHTDSTTPAGPTPTGRRKNVLGAYTLEGLALAVDPTSQRLVPTHMILY